MTHLVVAITAHGFGHAAQVAPVLDELWRRDRALRLTLLTELPEPFLRARIEAPFSYCAHAMDFGLCMKSVFEIDREASLERYRGMHSDWSATVDRAARFLAGLAPDCVLADVPYLALAAARRLGVPGVALCSLNWADIVEHYFEAVPEAERWLVQMRDAYRGAELFIRPEPAMPMAWLDNAAAVGAIGRRGRTLRDRLARMPRLAHARHLLLAAPGGIETRLPIESWTVAPDTVWLVPDSWASRHPNLVATGSLPLPFIDILASVDGVLGKCGYGTVVECVINGTPLAYLPRPDWPEEAGLVDWLRGHDAGAAIDGATLAGGGADEILAACRRLNILRVEPRGIAEAADLVRQYMPANGALA